MLDPVFVLEVLVGKGRKGGMSAHARVKVEVVFFCSKAGLLRPPSGTRMYTVHGMGHSLSNSVVRHWLHLPVQTVCFYNATGIFVLLQLVEISDDVVVTTS